MKKSSLLLLVVALMPNIVFGQAIEQLRNLGYVVVSPNGPDDGGDYGPNTPGTQTSGIQEAFNHAKDIIREVYIIGGGVGNGGAPVTYNLSTTLNIPWGQDWHCDGGDYVLNFTQASGDCLVIDSQMNCMLKFGVIKAPNLTSGALVKVAPTTLGPDNIKVCISCKLDITAIIGPGTTSGAHGTGLQLDNSQGGIGCNVFSVGEIKGCTTGILLNSTGFNTIQCPNVHLCSTLLQVDTGTQDKIRASLKIDGMTGTVVGAQINGGNENEYTLNWSGTFDAGNSLIFGNGAQDNVVYAGGLATNGVTNNATTKTNRVLPAKPVGFAVTTPAVPLSTGYVMNQQPYAIVAMILTPGSVTSWRVKDSAGTIQTVSTGLFAGQSIYLQPGESVRFDYSIAPTWVWRAIR